MELGNMSSQTENGEDPEGEGRRIEKRQGK